MDFYSRVIDNGKINALEPGVLFDLCTSILSSKTFIRVSDEEFLN